MTRRSLSIGFAALFAAIGLVGCKPDVGERSSLITSPRIIAVRGEPPEVKPGEAVSYDVLVASPEGSLSPKAAWAFCAEAPPLADNSSVSDACLDDTDVRPIKGTAPRVTAATPKDSCSLFGPDVPPGGFRPRDADVTGGYFQPVRARAAGQTAFAMERVTCNLADAPIGAVKEYQSRYQPNQNPTIAALTASSRGAAVDLGSVHAGEAVTLTLSWAAGDAEEYPLFDRESQSVVDRREALRASWFASAGQFESDRTGRDESDMATSTDNVWTAPEEVATVFLWAVLRDSRGGMAHTSLSIDVVP